MCGVCCWWVEHSRDLLEPGLGLINNSSKLHLVNAVKEDVDWDLFARFLDDILEEDDSRGEVSRYSLQAEVEIIRDLLADGLEQSHYGVTVRS